MQAQIRIEVKPKELHYQRNGICGIGFYSMVFEWKDRSEYSQGKDFIATFETDENDKEVKIESCRVIDPKNHIASWRGDNFGIGINEVLQELKTKHAHLYIYDLKKIINGGNSF